MGIRSWIRDLLILYLGYKAIGFWISGDRADSSFYVALFLVVALTVWFIIEKIGILEKFGY